MGDPHFGARLCAISAGLHRSEEHTSELQSLRHLVCRLLLEKKKQDAEREGRVGLRVGEVAGGSPDVRGLALEEVLRCFFFNDTATTEIYTLSLHDALPISRRMTARFWTCAAVRATWRWPITMRSEEHTSELQSLRHLVCRLLLEKKKN